MPGGSEASERSGNDTRRTRDRKEGETLHPCPTQAEAIKRLAELYNKGRLMPFIKMLFAAGLKWQRN